ncbi:hypothetical protein [Aestuariimicrobium ganziense]|uniref:hypothetical protein n=1 Tax=Aestuariimicrobium ganziense TaxID=2773677 RepID=UPI00194079AF|nr:hypothetical protein [Aestuariimicrobium ganziense]
MGSDRRASAPEPRELPREFGHDGITGLVGWDTGVRTREVSRPSEDDHAAAAAVLEQLLARAQGRRPR